ncbi:MAG: hypothetical protein LBL67_05120 [Coriobacteriales bacterium]|jgi:hypothetical protein|nr:hypothetical protein [Coriobacteriales bacterium]
MKNGAIIIPAGAYPAVHEIETAKILAKFGHHVEFLVPNRTKGVKTPDIIMDGLAWEIKSPIGKSRSTIQHAIKRAGHQAHNVILDLRRINLEQSVAISEARRQVAASRSIQRLLVVTFSGKTVTFF